MSWQEPPPDTHNGVLRYYTVSVFEEATRTNTLLNTSGSITHFTVPSLHPYYLYRVRVAAATVGLGPYSSPITFLMPETGEGNRSKLKWVFIKKFLLLICSLYHSFILSKAPTDSPQNLAGRPLSSRSIYIQWTSPPVEYQNGQIDYYTISCVEIDSARTLYTYTSSVTNITVSNLHPYYTYDCNVSAVTVSPGPFSTIISIATLEDSKYLIFICFL